MTPDDGGGYAPDPRREFDLFCNYGLRVYNNFDGLARVLPLKRNMAWGRLTRLKPGLIL